MNIYASIKNEFNNYKKDDITIILTIFIIIYIYCLHFAPKIENNYNSSFFGYLNRLHKSCLYCCKNTTCKHVMSNLRGNNYFVGTSTDNQTDIKNCVITFWGFTHFLMYMVLGYIFPSCFFLLLISGVCFEIYEYYRFNCEDLFDIPLNISGLLLGIYLSKQVRVDT